MAENYQSEGAKTSKVTSNGVFAKVMAWIVLIGLLSIVGLKMHEAGYTQAELGQAPDFELKTFDGETIRLSDFRGMVVVINFWASWCIPCREEAPVLEATWQEFHDQGVVFIGVDYVDTESSALAFIDEFNITYFNGPDIGTRIFQSYRARGVPETFFIDQRGLIQSVFIGAINEAELHQRIESLLVANSP